jgi:DNA-binding CsgD family transcriptional regulator
MLGYETLAQGEEARAASLFEEALLLGRAVGNPVTIARVLCGLGHLAWRQREESRAREFFEQSIQCLNGLEKFARARWIIASCLEGMAEIAWAEGKVAWSVRLCAAAIAHCPLDNPAAFLSALHPNYAETLEAAGNKCKKGAFAQLWAEGCTMTLEHILGKEGQARPGKRAKQSPPEEPTTQPPLIISHELTPRELEVLTLIAQGLKNKVMAERLTLSPNTINIHVQAVYRKLKVSSRAEATRRAFEHGLVKRITPESRAAFPLSEGAHHDQERGQ